MTMTARDRNVRPTLREAADSSYRFALYFVAVSVIRAIVGVAAGGPVLWLVEGPVVTLAIFFTGAFILQTVGAVYPDPNNHLQLDVSPWFAWLICGAFVTFMVGLLAEGHQEGAVALRAGAVGAVAWVGLIAVLWLTMRVVRGRGGARRLWNEAPFSAPQLKRDPLGSPNSLSSNPMISRIWHGWTTLENADAYERLLRSEIFEGIVERGIDGFLGVDLLRRGHEHEVEFVTVMWFTSLAAVRAFAGTDYEAAVVPAAARAMLRRFDARSAHYDVRERRVA